MGGENFFSSFFLGVLAVPSLFLLYPSTRLGTRRNGTAKSAKKETRRQGGKEARRRKTVGVRSTVDRCSCLLVSCLLVSLSPCLLVSSWRSWRLGGSNDSPYAQYRLRGVLLRQARHDAHGFQTDAHDLADEAHDVLLIVRAIGIGADAAALVLADLILVDHPVQGAAVAEAVLKRFRRNARESQRRVDVQGRLVLAEPHLVLDLVRQRHAFGFDPLQGMRFERFIIQVQAGQLL